MYVLIIGCGKLGSNLAKALSSSGLDVCILDRDEDKLDALGSGFNGQRIRGVEFDNDKLIEAGVENADILLAVTPDDNVNITVSLIADRIHHVPKVIARINNPGKAFIYDMLNIKTINPVQSEIDLLQSKLLIDGLEVLSALDFDYEVLELRISKKVSESIGNIEQKFSCIISGLSDGDNLCLPDKDTSVKCGDRIICTISKKNKGKLTNYLCREILI